ncbi:MAG: DNA internalization-related competence protein ComEC/Rec2 [Methylomicrobium sp.]
MPGNAIAFAAGIWFIQQLPVLPDRLWIILGCLLAGLAFYLGLRKTAFSIVGISWAIAYADIQLSNRLPANLEGKIIQIEGSVTGLPVRSDRRVRFDIEDIVGPEGMPSKLRLSWYYPECAIKAGQRWRFSVKLKRPHGSLNPGGFDYELWLFSDGIGATGYVRDRPQPVLIAQQPSVFSVSVWRQQIADALDRLDNHLPSFGIIKALTIGDKKQMNRSQWDILRKTGTVHLTAISGLHIGLISGLIYLLSIKIWAWTGILRYSPQQVAALCALSVGSLYAGLAGFSIPTRRALIMLAVFMLSILCQRNTRFSHNLALALMLVLAFDPLAITAPGFWLSFLAVALIGFNAMGRLGKAGRSLNALRIHAALALGLSPILLIFFYQTSLIAPLANVIAVPVVTVLIVPTLLAAVLLIGIIPDVSKMLLKAVDWSIEMLLGLLSKLADFSFAVLDLPQPSVSATAIALAGVALLSAPRGLKGRWLGLLMLGPLVFPVRDELKTGEVKLTLLDVGQGLSAVVQTRSHRLVFDTGARFDHDSDSGLFVVIPFLRHEGIDSLDAMIISHGDNDHIGGAASLLSEIPVTTLYSSVPEQIDYDAVQHCQAGQNWSWDGVSFEILSPPGHGKSLFSENDRSCVLKVESARGAILLTGDIEKNAEFWLVDQFQHKLRSDVLIVPHHGSNTSSTLPFLNAVNPKYALIPAGYKNRFGFPHPAVVKRLEQVGTEWLDTGREGAITVLFKANEIHLKVQRESDRRYWHSAP